LGDMEQRLVEKLHAAGQLRPGYLVRALREGRVNLFARALALLAGISLGEVHAILNSRSADRLMAVCEKVGVDRSAFPTMLEMVQNLGAAPAEDWRRARATPAVPGQVTFVTPPARSARPA
jgi:uncharacterized protein (DUF2336 family)